MSENSSIKKILFGLGWTSFSTIFSGIAQILRLSILSRFLLKGDFGIVAILTFVLGLTQVVSDMGFSAAIMAEKILTKSKFISLYWLQFIVFNGFAIIIAFCSPLVADYYDEPSLKILLPLILLELVFVSIGKLYDTVLQKKMKFKVIAVRNIAAAFVSLCIAALLAVMKYGVYSLVLSTIFQAFIVNIWNFIAGQKEYKLSIQRIHFQEIAPLIRVGIYQMWTQIVDYLAAKLDIFFISSFIGISAVGIYNLAKELIYKFTSIINTIVSKVMLPVLAEQQDDIEQLRRTFLAMIQRLSLLNVPIIGFMFLFASEIVDVFYGSNYTEAVRIVQILAVGSIFSIINQPNSLISVVCKRTDITFIYTVLRLVIISVLLFLFAQKSLQNAALCISSAYIIVFFISWYMLLYRVIQINLLPYLRYIYKPWIGVIISILIVFFIFNHMKENSLVICIKCLLYIFSYGVYLFSFERKTLSEYVSIINK